MMNYYRLRSWTGGLALAAVFGLSWWAVSMQRRTAPPLDRVDFGGLLAAWQRSTPNAFPQDGIPEGPPRLPSDHAAHPRTPAEVWEVMMLVESGKQSYALRVELDRLGADPEASRRRSRWAAHHFFRSAVSITGLSDGRFSAFEHYARGALDLSGYEIDPPRVRVGGDSLEWRSDVGAVESLAVTIEEHGLAAELRLSPLKPAVSPEKSSSENGRWQRYAVPRSRASGTLMIQGRRFSVEGIGWISHTWGALPPVGGQIAFDRWTLLLDDGQELALSRMRRRDGSGIPMVQGFRVAKDGIAESFDPDAIELQPSGYEGGYPVRWRLRIPALAIDLKLSPTIPDPAQVGAAGKWDGAIEAKGTRDGVILGGWGFMQLDGY